MSRDIELYLPVIYKKDTDIPAEKRTGPCLRQDSASGAGLGHGSSICMVAIASGVRPLRLPYAVQ